MKHRYRSVLTLVIAAGAFLSSIAPARADVKDDANYFSPDARQKADEIVKAIEQKHGEQVVIETVPTLSGVPAAGKAREDFYQAEVTRRGKEAGVKGIYILITKEPQSLYAGVDPQTQRKAFTLNDRAKLRDTLLQHFRAKDFDGGLLAGMQLIDQTMTANGLGGASTAGPVARSNESPAATPAPAGSNSGRSTPAVGAGSIGIFSLLCIGVGIVAIFMLVRGLIRSRQNLAGGNYGPPGMGQPGLGMGQPGFDPRYQQQQSGGGMGRGILGGLLGGVAGGYLYDQMRGHVGNDAHASQPPMDSSPSQFDAPADTSGFGDFGSGDSGGGGGDFGGGDSGGGGGDF